MPSYDSPRWLTGRSRTPLYTLEFSLESEWAPLVAVPSALAHFTKRGELLAAMDAKYLSSAFPTWSSDRGPYVHLYPDFQLVAGSVRTVSASPYPPDSTLQYIWSPSGDPGGGWIEANRQVADYQAGWRLIMSGGDGSGLSQNQFIPVGSAVTFWYFSSGIGASPGPMGAVVYSATGVPGGVSIPSSTYRSAPDDWERTHGTLYSTPLSGTITFSGGAREEFFTNLDLPQAINAGLNAVPADQVSEIGTRIPDDPGPPWARQYSEQRALGSVQTITVDLGVYGTYSLTTAAGGTMPFSGNWLAPFAQVSSFTHALGSAGSPTSSGYSFSAAWSAGGLSVGPVSHSHSDSGGAAGHSGGTANSNALGGSSAWPSFPVYVPGGGQSYRGGVQVGKATSFVKIPCPESLTLNAHLHRLPDQDNDVVYDVQVDSYSPTGGVAPPVVATLSGVTAGSTYSASYDNRASRGQTDVSGTLGGTQTNGAGGSTWEVTRPTQFGEYGMRLAGSNATGLAVRRLAIRGKRWDLYTALAPASVDILIDPWPTRTDGAGVTTSVVSGKLRIVSTAAGSTHFPIDAVMPEYRLHRVRVRSVGADNLRLRIRRFGALATPSQHLFDWTITTNVDGSWTECELDPLESYVGPCHAISPGILTQNQSGQWWQLDTFEAGTIEVEWLRAEVRTLARLDCARTRMDTDPAALVGTVDGSPYRLALVATDDLVGHFGGWDIAPSASPSSIKPWGHVLPWNALVDSLGPFPQADWYDSDNFEYVAGAGLMKGASWGSWIDQAAETATVVKCQELFERVVVYPGAGDVFGGSYGLTTTLEFGLLLGSAVHGLELGDVEDGADWPDIVALDPALAERARGVVATDENYGLLSPDLRAAIVYSARLDPEDDATQRLSLAGVDRKIFRTLWLLVLFGDPLTVDTARRRIISAEGKRLACYHAEDRTLDTLSEEHPPARWLSLDVDPHTRQLWALGKLGGELVLYVSEDWGDTVWEVLRVTGKSGVVISDPVRGVTATYYEDAAGAVQQLLRLPDGTTVGPTAVQLSGSALVARVLGSALDQFAAGRHLLKVKQAGVLKVIAGQDLLTATFEPWIV